MRIGVPSEMKADEYRVAIDEVPHLLTEAERVNGERIRRHLGLGPIAAGRVRLA